MYCGNPLQLPDELTAKDAVNEVDARYLDTRKIESRETAADSDVNFIDRL